MESSDKWFEFSNYAQSILLRGQEIDSYKQTIQLAIEPSFEKSIFLQIVLNIDNCFWYRTTWERLIDAPKFSNPIESLKYIGKEIKPTIIYENGIIERENINSIVDFIESLSLKPIFDSWGGIILDGIKYTLKIGVENTEIIYKWHHLPEEWKELSTLTKLLEELNQNLK
jgi:hypothetical protein